MVQPRKHIAWYIIADAILYVFAWLLFYYGRTVLYDYKFYTPPGFYLGLTLFVSGWLALNFTSGIYNRVYYKSRVLEVVKTIGITLIGCLVLFFFFILKNPHDNNVRYYAEFFLMFSIVLFFSVTWRIMYLNHLHRQIRNGNVFFNALVIGSVDKAEHFLQANKSSYNAGFRFVGFLNINGGTPSGELATLPCYHGLENVKKIIKEKQIEEIVLAIEKNERKTITTLLQVLSNEQVDIKLTADTLDILTREVQTTNVLGVPLIDLHSGQLPFWQQNVKRIVDILFSLVGSIIISPLLLYTIIRIKICDGGKIFYSQQRIGYKGKPFKMYKFRSMIANAEPNGPLLSSDDDIRITKWGRVMRKWRLDELPQLWNIFKGEMSMVGPRPERSYYVQQLLEKHPEYNYIFKVKPGLTSWGMVKHGYASSIEEMSERLKYDLLYVENVSLILDFKIMLYTIVIIMSGKGK